MVMPAPIVLVIVPGLPRALTALALARAGSAVVWLALRVVVAGAVRGGLVAGLAGFAGRVVDAAYWLVSGLCLWVVYARASLPLLLFFPIPSLSTTSSAHWMCLRSSGAARKRKTPEGADRRRTGFGCVCWTVWLPVSRDGVAVREGTFDIVECLRRGAIRERLRVWLGVGPWLRCGTGGVVSAM